MKTILILLVLALAVSLGLMLAFFATLSEENRELKFQIGDLKDESKQYKTNTARKYLSTLSTQEIIDLILEKETEQAQKETELW